MLVLIRSTQSAQVQDMIDEIIDKPIRDQMKHMNFKVPAEEIELFNVIHS